MLKAVGGWRKTTHNLISDNEMHFEASRQTSEVGGGKGEGRGGKGEEGGEV